MAELSINSLMQGAADVADMIGRAATGIAENSKRQEDEAKAQAKVYETVAEDVSLVKRTEETAKLQAQQGINKAATAAGIDPANGADAIVDLMGKLQVANKEVEVNIKEARKLNEINPLQNPIDWIVGQIKLPHVEDKLKGSANEAQVYSTQLAQVNQAVQQSAQTYNVLKESVTAASIEASARVAAAEATLRAQQARIEGFKYNSDGIAALANANKDAITLMFQAKSAQNAEKQLNIGLEHMALDKERFNWQKEEKKAADTAKAEGKQLDELNLEYINKSLASNGMPLMSGLEAKNAVTLLKSGASKELTYHWENGRRIAAAGVPMIGSTPAESAEVLRTFPNNLPETRLETARLLKEAEEALALNKAIDKKDKAAANQFVDTYVRDQVKAQYSNVQPNTGNLFDIGDVRSYVGMNAIKDLGVTKKFITPLITAGQPLTDPKLILSLGVKAVADGTITSSDFQDLATVYQVASQVTQQSRGFTGFGIVPPNAGRNYFTRAGNHGIVDMTNPTELGRVLSKDLAYRTIQNNRAKVLREMATAPDPQSMRK